MSVVKTQVTVEEAFNLFDQKGEGSIPSGSLGAALRSLGKRLTEESVGELKAKADADGGGKVTLAQFKDFLGEADLLQKTAVDIEGAFRIFEKESELKSHGMPGTIDKRVLRHALCSLGDKLTKDEVDKFMEGFAGQAISLEDLLSTVKDVEAA